MVVEQRIHTISNEALPLTSHIHVNVFILSIRTIHLHINVWTLHYHYRMLLWSSIMLYVSTCLDQKVIYISDDIQRSMEPKNYPISQHAPELYKVMQEVCRSLPIAYFQKFIGFKFVLISLVLPSRNELSSISKLKSFF